MLRICVVFVICAFSPAVTTDTWTVLKNFDLTNMDSVRQDGIREVV